MLIRKRAPAALRNIASPQLAYQRWYGLDLDVAFATVGDAGCAEHLLEVGLGAAVGAAGLQDVGEERVVGWYQRSV